MEKILYNSCQLLSLLNELFGSLRCDLVAVGKFVLPRRGRASTTSGRLEAQTKGSAGVDARLTGLGGTGVVFHVFDGV